MDRGALYGGDDGRLLGLSAKTATALEKQTENLVEYLKSHPDTNLADVAFTLQVGRHGQVLGLAVVPGQRLVGHLAQEVLDELVLPAFG